jgi:hypothetical protein
MSDNPYAPDMFSESGSGGDIGEVLWHLEVLPDGQDTFVAGDPARCADYAHREGDNAYGFANTCGITSVETVLRSLGYEVTEGALVERALDHGWCHIDQRAAFSGQTSLSNLVDLLGSYGVPAHYGSLRDLTTLSQAVQDGEYAIIRVDANTLYGVSTFEVGEWPHAVAVTGVALDPVTKEVQGFFINDSHTGIGGQFVDAKTLERACIDHGGGYVVTDRFGSDLPDPATQDMGGWKWIDYWSGSTKVGGEWAYGSV